MSSKIETEVLGPPCTVKFCLRCILGCNLESLYMPKLFPQGALMQMQIEGTVSTSLPRASIYESVQLVRILLFG